MSTIGSLNASILKAKSRDLLRDNINRVRFELLTNHSLSKVLSAMDDEHTSGGQREYNDYLRMIRDECISEADFMAAIQESRECIELLTKYKELAQALLALDWLRQPPAAVEQYQLFVVDLLSAHNKYTKFAVHQLVRALLPRDVDQYMWTGGRPAAAEVELRVQRVLETIERVLAVIPLSYSMVLEEVESVFPFYTKASFLFAGFAGCVLRLMVQCPPLKADLFRLLLDKLVVLDCYTPREEIDLDECDTDSDNDSSSDCDDDDDDDKDRDQDDMFHMEMDVAKTQAPTTKPISTQADKNGTDDAVDSSSTPMKSVQAETLDLCMEQLFAYLAAEHRREARSKCSGSATFDLLLDVFQVVLLPAHNTHHVQFVLFYYSSFGEQFADAFVQLCWQRLRDINLPSPMRQTAVGYLASALSRSMFLGVDVVQDYLAEMCTWIRMYMKRCDAGQTTYTLKAHGPFFATCQALFYVISFRSRELTAGSKNLRFLQSLQLNAIVASPLNPLRVCQSAVATAFSGVTRAHQLAYCHTILERNARKKLATISGNDLLQPVECLDTFFPFDQYMLKKSGRSIQPIYRQYQASEAEEANGSGVAVAGSSAAAEQQRQKKRRKQSEEVDEVDFIAADKRCRILELSKSFDRDLQFYNISTTPKM